EEPARRPTGTPLPRHPAATRGRSQDSAPTTVSPRAPGPPPRAHPSAPPGEPRGTPAVAARSRSPESSEG
ncbi:hypothetical protein K5549_021823, partial [Capra hircus]